MKTFLIIVASLALSVSARAQVLPTLPQVWIDNNEATDGVNCGGYCSGVGYAAPAYELSLPSTWVAGPPAGCSFNTPYWSGSPTQAGLQSAINDIETCRTTHSGTVCTILDIPSFNYSNTTGTVVPQSSYTVVPTVTGCFNILRSTQDSNLPNGRTVCSHGIQDNLATSIDPGVNNSDCAGDAMYYQLGTTITPISTGAFTLANGTVTNTSAYNDVQYMWTAECTATNCVPFKFCSPTGSGTTFPQCANAVTPSSCTGGTLSGCIGPDHWLVEDLEARMNAGNTGNQSLITTGNSSETTVAQLASYIDLRKVWPHGDWSTLAAGMNSITDAFHMLANHWSIVDSQASQLLRPGAEGHVIGLSLGNYGKIDHNWLEGQSAAIFCGGFASNITIPGLVTCQDLEIRRNRRTYPYAWIGQSPISGNAHWNGDSLVRKNADEFKMAQRVVEDGNIYENVDNSGGQSGVMISRNIRNCSGGDYCQNYQTIISDLTFTNNILRHTCEGFNISAHSGGLGGGQGTSHQLYRALISNNLFYDYSNNNPGCTTANSSGMILSSPGQSWQGTITENGAGTAATFVANCEQLLGGCPGQLLSATVLTGGSGCVAGDVTVGAPDLLTSGGTTGQAKYTCSGGALAIITLTPNFLGSGYLSPPSCSIPTGTGTCSFAIVTTPTPLGNSSEIGGQAMDILAGDPVAISMCTSVTAFNSPLTLKGAIYQATSIGPLATAGSAEWNGTFDPSNVTVTYPWSATPNAVDSAGYCTVTNVQGSPQDFQFTHNTGISDATKAWGSGNTYGYGWGANLALRNVYRDNILLAGGWAGTPPEGTATEIWLNDVNTLSADHLVWPTRTAANYTEYGGACGSTGCHPPNTMYFPNTPYCTGASPTSACVGFVGAMSLPSGPMPISLSDYHDFRLIAGSSFKAGGATPASDGTDMGTNITALDAAQTLNRYSSSGAFPDNPSAPPSAAFSGSANVQGNVIIK